MDYTITRRNAGTLAHKIETFWHHQGHRWVRTWVETDPAIESLYVVRSNIRLKWTGATYEITPWGK